MNWYGHVRRMNEERLPRKILEWYPPGRRRKERPRNSWLQELKPGMREKGINSMEWIDKQEWRIRIKLKLFRHKKICKHRYSNTLRTSKFICNCINYNINIKGKPGKVKW